jgi:hypothetical protein
MKKTANNNRKLIRQRYSKAAQDLLMLEGEPFSLEKRDHLLSIYDDNKKFRLMMFSRQAEKSTTLASKAITRCTIHRFYRNLYVAPREDQIKIFSHQKVTPFIEDSPKIKKFFQDKSCKTSVFHKSFTNRSEIIMKAAYLTPDAARGITADGLQVDELQDIIQDHLPVLESCLLHAKPWAAFREYSGTPKTMQNPMQYYWERSKQIEWVIKCSGCNNYNLLGMKNIGRDFLICSKPGCSRQIYPYNGFWAVTNRDGKFPAYRVCYLMVPWCSWRNPEDAEEPGVIQMMESWKPHRFMNETLAISYDDAENPLSREELMAACEDRPFYESLGDIPSELKNKLTDIVAGIDWGTSLAGKSATVISIGSFCTDGKFRVLYMYRFPPTLADMDDQVSVITKILNLWQARVVGSDWGFGYAQNSRLSKKFGPRLCQMYLSSSQKAGLVYNPVLKLYTLSRNQLLTKMFLEIQDRHILFPQWSNESDIRLSMEYFSTDFLKVGKEYSAKTRTAHYVHPTGVADDAVHSTNFLRTAYMVSTGDFATHIDTAA